MKEASMPTSGCVIIEWSTAAGSHDAADEERFSWSIRSEPPVDDERLVALLREITDVL